MRSLVYSIKEKVNNLSKEIVKSRVWDIECRDIETIYKDNHALLEYLRVIDEEENNRLKGFKSCLNSKETDKIKAKIFKIVGVECSKNERDVIVDDSQRNSWIISHPRCVSYEEWEEWSYHLCDMLDIEFSIKTQACDLALDIVTKKFSCDLILMINAYKKACNLGIELDVERERCLLELNVLAESGCDLDLKTYVNLKKCGVSFDLVKTVYECNLKIDINAKNCPVVVSDLSEYALDCFPEESDITVLNDLGFKATKDINKILNNYK